MPQRKVTWTKKATRQFNNAIEYIRQQSEQKCRESERKDTGKGQSVIG